jgi:hypothetical protein
LDDGVVEYWRTVHSWRCEEEVAATGVKIAEGEASLWVILGGKDGALLDVT